MNVSDQWDTVETTKSELFFVLVFGQATLDLAKQAIGFDTLPKRLVKLVVVVVGSGQNKIHLWDFDHWTRGAI